MKYSIKYENPEGYDVSLSVLKADEFLKEYWGQEVFFTRVNNENRLNTSLFNPMLNVHSSKYNFFAFRNKQDFDLLEENEFTISPPKVEVFEVSISSNCIVLTYYNSFTTNERERQFLKLADAFKSTIEGSLPLIRIRQEGRCKTLMCRYRRSEGRIGFSLTPYIIDIEEGCEYLWIYTSDFEYLRPFIGEVDDTSCTDIPKYEWQKIIHQLRIYNTDDVKERAFIDYFTSWLEQQLRWASYIEIYGNL